MVLSCGFAALVVMLGAEREGSTSEGERVAKALWTAADGDFAAFAREHRARSDEERAMLLRRFETNLEALDGHLYEISRALRLATDLDQGPLLPADKLFAGYDVGARVTEDLFASKLAFVALLNFPVLSLADRVAKARSLSRREWAEARLTGRFTRRVPADVRAAVARVEALGELYISEYNIWTHHLLDERGARPFPKGQRLISHWNLRDELKARYADPEGLAKQRLIARVMDRIVRQEIPAAVIDDPRVDWAPFSNQARPSPVGEVEPAPDSKPRPSLVGPLGAPDGLKAREADVRYRHLLEVFKARRREDPFSPTNPTAMSRAFELSAQLEEARVRALLLEVLSSPLAPQVGQEIAARLGRPLEPHDLWYAGFRPRAALPQAELDAKVRARYPSAAAFQSDIPRILRELGFSSDRAALIASRIVVEPSRGAGHAMEAMRRGDRPRLRTRIERGGMDYKGYNIAVHELGHNVEQVISLYDVDSTLLRGVPSNAFTEALAFVFQARDLTLLGLAAPDARSERERVLGTFWSTFEIAGVALAEMELWRWMYQHPDATPAQLREAALRIYAQLWDEHYAKILGGKGAVVLLGIYSHLISTPLYLFHYPLGHLIAFQIEERAKATGAGGGEVGPHFERMARIGNVVPDHWMELATGSGVSAAALLRATAAALEAKN